MWYHHHNYYHFADIGKGKLTVGKIYGGLLILENWKSSKFGHMPTQKVEIAWQLSVCALFISVSSASSTCVEVSAIQRTLATSCVS